MAWLHKQSQSPYKLRKMDKQNATPFMRALASVEGFSDKAVAVLPETPSLDMLGYVAHVTGEDMDKLKRLYELFVTTGRLDQLGSTGLPASGGFAEE